MEELIDKLNALETIDADSLREAIESSGFGLIDDATGDDAFSDGSDDNNPDDE